MNRIFAGLLLLLQCCFVHPLVERSLASNNLLISVRRHDKNCCWIDIQRGGASSVKDDEDDDDDEKERIDEEAAAAEDEEEESDHSLVSDEEVEDESDVPLSKQSAVQVAGKTLFGLLKASIRALSVAFSPGSGDRGVTVLGRITQRLTKAWNSFVSSPQDDDGDLSTTINDRRDFANYLATAYKVKATRNDVQANNETLYPAIAGGSIQDALLLARSQSRLLLVMIPSNRPDRQTSVDTAAIQSFLSAQVAQMAEKRAHKTIPTPSFLLWSARAKSPEAVVAAKRLNMELTHKRPILLVATSNAAVSSCQVLAQHHCNPPPSATSMASWMNAIRKRHKKLYQKMNRIQTELQIAQERVEGYRTSMVQEKQRQIDLQTQKEQEEARAQALAAHAAFIQQRRTEFAAALPDPSMGSMIVALRCADGSSHQRKFDPETATLETVLNWADVVAVKERERMRLTTMNGKQSYMWDWDHRNRTLRELGWGNMVAFRVTETTNESKESA